MEKGLVTIDIKYNEKLELSEYIKLLSNIIDLGISFSNPHIFLGTITNMDDEIERAASIYLIRFKSFVDEEQIWKAKTILDSLADYFSKRSFLFKAIDLEPAMKFYRIIERFKKGYGSLLLKKILSMYMSVNSPKRILPSIKENISTIHELSEFCFSLIPVEVVDRLETNELSESLFFLNTTLPLYCVPKTEYIHLESCSGHIKFRNIYELLISKYYKRLYDNKFDDRLMQDYSEIHNEISEDFLYKMLNELVLVFDTNPIEDNFFSASISGEPLATAIAMFIRKVHIKHTEEKLAPLVKKIFLIIFNAIEQDEEKMKRILKRYLYYNLNISNELNLLGIIEGVSEFRKIIFDLKLEGFM